MSRAMNTSLTEARVRAMCEKSGVAISALEILPSGGSRLVCMREEGAEEMRVLLKGNLIEGRVPRFAFQRSQNSQYG